MSRTYCGQIAHTGAPAATPSGLPCAPRNSRTLLLHKACFCQVLCVMCHFNGTESGDLGAVALLRPSALRTLTSPRPRGYLNGPYRKFLYLMRLRYHVEHSPL